MTNPLFIQDAEVEKLRTYLGTNPKSLIITHANPDGDAIGSALGLYLALSSAGLTVDVCDKDGVPDYLNFCPGSEAMKIDFNENDYDGFFILDCGDKAMTRMHETHPRMLSAEVMKINVDHHASNDNFGNINFVATDACSTTQILFHLIQSLGIRITPDIATALLLGICTDTGSFMHQNTTPQTYLDAGALVKLGGNISKIAQNVFRSYEFKTLKLWGRVLQDLHVTPEGAAIVGVHRDEYETLGAARSDLAGVIDYINAMPEAQYSVMLSEDEKGNVKASLRTRKDDVDVNALAKQFGGGGHVKASGFTVKDSKLKKEVKWKIVKE